MHSVFARYDIPRAIGTTSIVKDICSCAMYLPLSRYSTMVLLAMCMQSVCNLYAPYKHNHMHAISKHQVSSASLNDARRPAEDPAVQAIDF